MNNKGFAISGILYGILILFLTVLASILNVLVIRLKDLDEINAEIVSNVEDKGCASIDSVVAPCNVSFTYDNDLRDSETRFTTKVRGKYELEITDSSSGKTICYTYLPKNVMIVVNENKLKYLLPNENGQIDISNFTEAKDVNLVGSNCANQNISSFIPTKIFSSIYNK